MVVRPATHNDLTGLCELARVFVAESTHPYTYDQALSRYAFENYLDNPMGALTVAEDKNLLGFWSAFVCQEYISEPQCYVNKFYVAPWGRGSGAARLLMESLAEWADLNECVDTWVTATAGIGKDKEFIGLCDKYGFESGGLALVRR